MERDEIERIGLAIDIIDEVVEEAVVVVPRVQLQLADDGVSALLLLPPHLRDGHRRRQRRHRIAQSRRTERGRLHLATEDLGLDALALQPVVHLDGLGLEARPPAVEFPREPQRFRGVEAAGVVAQSARTGSDRARVCRVRVGLDRGVLDDREERPAQATLSPCTPARVSVTVSTTSQYRSLCRHRRTRSAPRSCSCTRAAIPGRPEPCRAPVHRFPANRS